MDFIEDMCDKVSHWLATGQWFSPGTPVSSTNKIDHHNITEILLKVALKHNKPIPKPAFIYWFMYAANLGLIL
jgi:hypothetical protein